MPGDAAATRIAEASERLELMIAAAIAGLERVSHVGEQAVADAPAMARLAEAVQQLGQVVARGFNSLEAQGLLLQEQAAGSAAEVGKLCDAVEAVQAGFSRGLAGLAERVSSLDERVADAAAVVEVGRAVEQLQLVLAAGFRRLEVRDGLAHERAAGEAAALLEVVGAVQRLQLKVADSLAALERRTGLLEERSRALEERAAGDATAMASLAEVIQQLHVMSLARFDQLEQQACTRDADVVSRFEQFEADRHAACKASVEALNTMADHVLARLDELLTTKPEAPHGATVLLRHNPSGLAPQERPT